MQKHVLLKTTSYVKSSLITDDRSILLYLGCGGTCHMTCSARMSPHTLCRPNILESGEFCGEPGHRTIGICQTLDITKKYCIPVSFKSAL